MRHGKKKKLFLKNVNAMVFYKEVDTDINNKRLGY